MPFVSVTRLRIRSLRFLPGFFVQAFRSQRQVRHAEGLRGGSLLADRHWTFWTLTVWDSGEKMRSYILSGAHRETMPKLLNWCDEASLVHWEQSDDTLPDWHEAEARMRSEGRPSKVRHPSRRHQDLSFKPPRSFTGSPLFPHSSAGRVMRDVGA